MKRPHLAILFSASFLWLAGCSYSSVQSLNPSRDEPASAQTVSPSKNYEKALQLAWEAAVLVQNPPHSQATWQEARVKWRQAIRLLEAIPNNASVSDQAKRKLADYRIKYRAIEQRLRAEKKATDHFNQAQTIAWQAAVTVQNPPHSLKIWQRARDKWKQASELVSAVPHRTTVSQQAQARISVYRNNFLEIDRRLAAEHNLLDTVQRFSDAATRLYTLQNDVITGESSHVIGLNYQEYEAFVRSLQTDLRAIGLTSTMKSHPIYADLKTALADYEFALTVWQAYQRHRDANAEWLGNDDFFNQMIPLSLIDKDKLTQRYKVKVYPRGGGGKVPLKLAVWSIWEVASQHTRTAEQQAAKLY